MRCTKMVCISSNQRSHGTIILVVTQNMLRTRTKEKELKEQLDL